MEGGVDVVLVQENLDLRCTNSQIPDVRPMAYLSRCVIGLGNRHGIGLIQLIIESTSVMVAMDVVGRIYHDTAFFLAFNKPNRGQEDAVDETPDPAWKHQNKLVVDVGDDLLENRRTVRRDPLMVVIGVAMRHVSTRAGV